MRAWWTSTTKFDLPTKAKDVHRMSSEGIFRRKPRRLLVCLGAALLIGLLIYVAVSEIARERVNGTVLSIWNAWKANCQDTDDDCDANTYPACEYQRFEQEEASAYFDDYGNTYKRAHVFGYRDANGRIAIAAQYPSAARRFIEGVAWVWAPNTHIDRAAGYIDGEGRWLIGPQYGDAYDFAYGRGRVYVYSHERGRRLYGFVDRKGNETVTPQYEYAEDYCHGYVLVGKETKISRILFGPNLLGALDAGVEPYYRFRILDKKGNVVPASHLNDIE